MLLAIFGPRPVSEGGRDSATTASASLDFRVFLLFVGAKLSRENSHTGQLILMYTYTCTYMKRFVTETIMD